jgi:iron(III) transport system permease protein
MAVGRHRGSAPFAVPVRATSVAAWLPLLLVMAFAVLWPLASLELQSVTDGLRSYRAAFSAPGIGRCILLTIALAVADVGVAVVVGTGLAWCALHVPRRWQAFGSLVPLMPLLVPSVAAVAGWIFLLSPRAGYVNTVLRGLLPAQDGAGPLDVYTFSGMVFVSGLIFSSFIFMFVHSGLRNAGAEYEEAAAVAGASPLRSFWTVTLPQLRPSLAYGGGIVFMLALGQFSAPVLLGVPANIDVLTTRMFSMLEGYPIPFGEVAALGTPLLAAGLFVALFQRWFVGDLRRYVTVGGRAQHSPRKPKRWGVIWISVFGGIAVLLPLIALSYAALSPFWTRNLTLRNLTTRHFVAVFSNQNLLNAITTSIYAAVATIAIVVPLGYWASRILTGRAHAPRLAVRAIDLLLLLPFAVPATLFGFALLFAYTKPPFLLYGTQAIIIVAYATIMMPYATRILVATLVAYGQEPWEASAICGAAPLRTFVRVTLPLMRRSATVAAVMVFILLFQEFAVSLLVRSASVQVVGSVLYDQYVGGSYPGVAVLALMMVAMTALGVIVMTAAGGADALKRAAGSG